MSKGASFGEVALGVLAGMTVGMVATYAMSGDAALLRKNMRKAERGCEKAVHEIEHRFH